MNDSLQGMAQKQKAWTLAAWALLVLAPWIQLAAISLAIGQNALAAYPVWSDELGYWRSLFSWVNVGFSSGYNGIGEHAPLLGTLNVHGLAPLLLYGGWSSLFGLSYNSIVVYNALWISLAALAFCLLAKPKAGTAALLAVLFMVFAPAVLYASTSMTELFNYALLLLFAGLFLRGQASKKAWPKVLCWVVVVLACLYRAVYFVLFIPLIVVDRAQLFSKKTVALLFLALGLSAGAYLTGAAITAPYPSGFLYNWIRVEDFGIFIRMFLSHAKGNLYDYFIRYTASPIEDGLRWLYCAATAWTLLGSFLRLERNNGRLRLRIGLNPLFIACFLLLFVPFAVVIMMYETNDWNDFRTLAPFLWVIALLLASRGKKALPSFLLAGSLAMVVCLCTLPPVGAFQDEYRFTQPPYSQEVAEACLSIEYKANTVDPFENTIRADLATFQVMETVDPRMGLLYGWFTPANTGKSRWVLTDHLKIVMQDYAPVYTVHGAKVYVKTTNGEP